MHGRQYQQIGLFPFFQPILLHNSCLKSHKISHGAYFPLHQLPWGDLHKQIPGWSKSFPITLKEMSDWQVAEEKAKCLTSIGMPIWGPKLYVGIFACCIF